jgi:long-chain acyl-CoA synthetase
MTTYLDRPWLQSYKLGPYKLDHSLEPYPQEPVHQALEDAATRYPGQTAVLFLGRSLKYPELNALADRLASALIGLGVRKGDRVCLFLPNCLEYVISDWAVLKAGAVVVPTSVLRTEDGLVHELRTSGARVIVCREEALERVLAVRSRCDVEEIIITSTDGYDVADVSSPWPKGVHVFRTLLDETDGLPPSVEVDPLEDLCELAFTGGATGVPKGVMVTHANRFSCIRQGIPWIMKPVLRGFVGKASVLVAVPVFHSYGHYVLQSAANLAMRVILLPDPRDTQMMVQQITEHRPFLIPLVPTQLMRIAQADLGRMNALPMSGSAPLPAEVSQAFQKKTGMPISEAYGLTETSPLTHFNVSAFSKITGFMPQLKAGIGIPAPDTECKLLDPATDEEVPFGEAGEIVVRGPQIMKGYWPEAGSGLTSDGWLHTGDIARMEDDGYFQLVDRAKDMVNVSGFKVYTTEVDEVLFQHPAVLAAAAFGVPDPEAPGSERVMAVIQLKEELRGSVSEEEFRDLCRQHLAPYAVPKYIEFRDEMPMTVSEKIFKKALRDAAIARFREQGAAPAG